MALNAASELVAATVPQWRDKPSEPGWWVCSNHSREWYASALFLTQDDLDRGAPFFSLAVYGPIPAPPNGETK